MRNDAEETRFWRNQKVGPENTYVYDSLYQLISATGREMADIGQQGSSLPSATIPLPIDSSAFTNYTRNYTYDEAGNLTQVRHSAPATNNSYTTNITVSNRAVPSSLTETPAEVDALFTAEGQQKQLQPVQSLVWTPRNELLKVTPMGGGDGSESHPMILSKINVAKTGEIIDSISKLTPTVRWLMTQDYCLVPFTVFCLSPRSSMSMRNRQAGFTIFETMIALIVMISALSLGAMYMKNSADDQLVQNAAQNLQQITEAAQAYVRDNFATLKVDVGTDTKGKNIDINTLVTEKYLSDNFPKKNSFGQSYLLNIAYEQENMLRVTVLTQNGENIQIAQLKKIAGLAGGGVGYSATANKITGNQEGWTVDVVNIAKGHLASVNYVSGKDVVNAGTFLRRDKIDGHPEWNQMSTDLDMQGNAISMSKGVSTGLINYNGLILKDKQQSTLTSDELSFTSDRASTPTSITGEYAKPATYILNVNANDDSRIYKEVDDICGAGENSYGKIFFAGVRTSGKTYLAKFTCGPSDGYNIGSGRAYLTERLGVPPLDMNCQYTWTSRYGCNKPMTSDGRYYESLRSKFSNNTSQSWYYTDNVNGGRIDGTCVHHDKQRVSTACVVEHKSKLLSNFIISQKSSPDNAVGIPGRIKNDSACNAFGDKENLDDNQNATIIWFTGRFPPSYSDADDPRQIDSFDTCRRIKVQAIDDSSIKHAAPFINKETG